MNARYDIEPDRHGWSVVDVFTGEPVVIEFVPQVGLDVQDADALMDALNWQAQHGDRSILQ